MVYYLHHCKYNGKNIYICLVDSLTKAYISGCCKGSIIESIIVCFTSSYPTKLSHDNLLDIFDVVFSISSDGFLCFSYK